MASASSKRSRPSYASWPKIRRPAPPTPLVKAIQGGGRGGVLVAGTAATVREHFVRYVAEGNVDYLVINVSFGDMTHAEAERTLDAFIEEVMPAVREAS